MLQGYLVLCLQLKLVSCFQLVLDETTRDLHSKQRFYTASGIKGWVDID